MKTKTETTRTVADYIKLSKKGFTNKQIAAFWRKSVRSIAAYASNANR